MYGTGVQGGFGRDAGAALHAAPGFLKTFQVPRPSNLIGSLFAGGDLLRCFVRSTGKPNYE